MNRKIVIVNNNRILSQYFEKGMKELGYDVYTIIDSYPTPFKKTFFHKCVNIFFLKILRKNTYYRNANKKYLNNFYKECFNIFFRKEKNNRFDFGIVFRADKYDTNSLIKLHNKVDKYIAYQYDGMDGLIESLVDKKDIFDKIYVFDYQDVFKYKDKVKLDFITNFYIKEKLNKDNDVYYDLFYLGSYSKGRLHALQQFESFSSNLIISVDQKQEDVVSQNVNITSKKYSYQESLDLMKKCKTIIDIKQKRHDGLSFRFFEAIYYSKKIITDNLSVKKYDFYSANNILIVDYENIPLEEVKVFLEMPFKPLEPSIKEKYSLESWLEKAFDY
ncbi:hypothetical protein OBK25_01075 [Empedobacter falsenii]